ncbi:MAG: transcriptional regulator [Planctomycetes bacterium]|nr:transcriptional regulator [Planctomycetota bacterium]
MKTEERGRQFVRQWKILKRLDMLHYGITAEELAHEIGYSKRTIYRDLNVLQNAGFPLEKEKIGEKIKWLLTKGARTPSVPFTLTELMSLYFSKGLLSALQGTPFKEGIDSALDKIHKTLPVNAIDFILYSQETVVPKLGALTDYRNFNSIIEKLNRASREKRKCHITYLAYGRDKTDKHLFHPYALSFYEGGLYCVGYSELRRALRNFAIQRIKLVEVSDDKFTLLKDKDGEEFEVTRFLDESFGISHEGKLQDVVLRFSKEYAQWITERQWHPSQKIKKLPKGEIEMTLTVAGLGDLICWLLPMGDGVKVLKPKQLVDNMVKISQGIVKQYKKFG